MFDIGGPELLVIILAIIILFGPKKIPEMVEMFGRGMKHMRRAQQQFRDQMDEISNEVKDVVDVDTIKDLKNEYSDLKSGRVFYETHKEKPQNIADEKAEEAASETPAPDPYEEAEKRKTEFRVVKPKEKTVPRNEDHNNSDTIEKNEKKQDS